ncbi:MAG TPA: hypothetical protein VFA83_21165 [Acidimicrobiales bacterium]|nr:hypothetical protein [Acidimicrobiales bacterium]
MVTASTTPRPGLLAVIIVNSAPSVQKSPPPERRYLGGSTLVGMLAAKSGFWTFDHTTTIVLIVLGGAAVLFGFLAWRSSATWVRQAAVERSTDVQPRPSVDVPAYTPSGGEWSVTISSPGGSVVDGRVVVQDGHQMYAARFSIGDHIMGHPVMLRSEYPAQSSYRQVRVLVAKDRDGRWWDCVKEERLDAAWADTLDQGCIDWVTEQLRAA